MNIKRLRPENFYVIEPSIKFNNVDEIIQNTTEHVKIKKALNITKNNEWFLKVDDIKKYIINKLVFLIHH